MWRVAEVADQGWQKSEKRAFATAVEYKKIYVVQKKVARELFLSIKTLYLCKGRFEFAVRPRTEP